MNFRENMKRKKILTGFLSDFINNLLLIIFVQHNIFYLFYFGKQAISKQRKVIQYYNEQTDRDIISFTYVI